jgi:hypothetical protein
MTADGVAGDVLGNAAGNGGMFRTPIWSRIRTDIWSGRYRGDIEIFGRSDQMLEEVARRSIEPL